MLSALTRLALTTVALAALVYLGLLAYLRLNEGDILYQPLVLAGHPGASAEMLGVPYEAVSFTTADSVRLSAWVIPAGGTDSSGMWVMICHGNAGDISSTVRPLYYSYLRQLGVNIFAFDYRGYGQSEGSPSERGLYLDAEAAYDYLSGSRNVPARRIVIYGHSLGTGVATELASRREAGGLVLEGAYTSVTDRAQELYPYVPVRLVAASRFESIERIGRVRTPMLIMHAISDRVIPIGHGRRLFQAAREPKRFIALRGEHDDAFMTDRGAYFGAFGDFIRSLRVADR
ncbi:MAG TPA: alpha/beta hydrolase [Gemmatimonadaceae bacterium]|nr:alpha/beta hydrolase [Gemmatimonadaceae bacterium]